MGSTNVLNEVIIGFDSWDRPWDFHDYVAQSTVLPESDRALFESAWREATDAQHWRSADLAECSNVAANALRQGFPALNATAISAIARAASYQWR